MASGDEVLNGATVRLPATGFAQPAVISGSGTGGSQPAEQILVYRFDPATVEYVDLFCRLSKLYGGGGLTLTLPWAAEIATSGNVVWQAAMRRIAVGTTDIDSTAHTYSYQAATSPAPGAAGIVRDAAIAFTNGGQIDSLAAGEAFFLRVRRAASDAGDTMTGDAMLLADLVKLVET